MRTMKLFALVACLFFAGVAKAQNYTCTSETTAKCLTVNGANFWIVGEVRSFAFGGDAKSIIVQELRARGWLECEGQSLSNDDFPELSNSLGTTWGSRDPKNSFLVPDLRAMFLRGWNHAGSQQWSQQFPDPEGRLTPRVASDVGSGGKLGNTDGVGSMQASSVGNHTHGLSPAYSAHTAKILPGDGLPIPMIIDGRPAVQITNAAGIGAETRPSNAYVMYFIYVGPYNMTRILVDAKTGLIRRVKKPVAQTSKKSP
jgi:hypothetical protein